MLADGEQKTKNQRWCLDVLFACSSPQHYRYLEGQQCKVGGFNSQIFERRDDTLLEGRTIGGYAQFARSLGMRKSHELTRFTVHRQKPERQKQEDMR